MTETDTTPPATPVFPAGRYGKRREPRRRPWQRPVLAGLVVVVLAAGVATAFVLGQQYGDGRPYDPTVLRFYDVTDSQVVVEFTVRVPAGEVAVCAVRARGSDGAEVGREELRIDPPDEVTRPHVTHTLPTRARPVTGEVQRCWRDS